MVPICTFNGCSADAAPRHSPCCSSHGRDLCCEHYRFTHFVHTRCCTTTDSKKDD